MISKRVKSPEGGGSFGGLARYIANTEEKQNKLHSLWMVNCNARGEEPLCGDRDAINDEAKEDLDLGILEIENTQEMNQSARGSKTYHLIISFQSGEQLPQEDLAKIEKKFAASLGFSQHQRVVAAHHNTENFHLHVAYNMIDPETHNIHHPSWDYYARDRVCRAIEKEYNLKIDHGHDKWEHWRDEDKPRMSDKARDMEAHRHEQSFTGFVQEQKDEILADVEEAADWDSVHESLKERGLCLKQRGNGLVISDGVEHTKASNISREISKKKLQDRLGDYQASADDVPFTETMEQNKEAIATELDSVDNWQDAHKVFSKRNLELRERGNGFAVYQGKEHIALSKIDRNLTKKKLEQRLGTFEREESALDQIQKAPEMLGSVLESCEDWSEVHETLEHFNVKLEYRDQGYIEASFDDKDKLLDGGARFDGKVGHWYIPKGADPKDFKDFKVGFVLSDGKYHTMSHNLPGLDADNLKTRFGEPPTTSPKKQTSSYKTKPITRLKGKKQRDLWDRFLAKKRLDPTLSWKEFLLLMAGVDPMAVALLNAGRRLMGLLNSPSSQNYRAAKPAFKDPLKDEKYLPLYIRVPSKDRAKAKKAGAKWDAKMKSWFIPEKLQAIQHQEKFKDWPVGLPEHKQSISKKKARDMGLVEDEAMGWE